MSQIFTVESRGKQTNPSRFKNRSRMEIVAAILNIGRTGALKTHLMYKANLSYMVVSQYLGFLTSSDLIKEVFDEQGMAKLYQTTPRGLRYLEVYESLQSLASIDSQKKIVEKTNLFG
ncbi:MAG: winged helix-turn-helix domain-containing protein [Nitrososphaerales archaeon]